MPTVLKDKLRQYPRLAKALRVLGAGANVLYVFVISCLKVLFDALKGRRIEFPEAPDLVDYRYEDPDEPEFYNPENKPQSQQSSVILDLD